MSKLNAIEIKAFVPARDFALSKRFYADLGFSVAWSNDDLPTCVVATAVSCCKISIIRSTLATS